MVHVVPTIKCRKFHISYFALSPYIFFFTNFLSESAVDGFESKNLGLVVNFKNNCPNAAGHLGLLLSMVAFGL
jgi:hypothetical protein